MNCEQANEALQELLEGAIPPADSAALEEHLRACPACRGARAELQRLHEGLPAILSSALPEHPPSFPEKVIQDIRKEVVMQHTPEEHPFARGERGLGARILGAFRNPLWGGALAAVVVGLVALYTLRREAPQEAPIQSWQGGPSGEDPGHSVLPSEKVSIFSDGGRPVAGANAEVRAALPAAPGANPFAAKDEVPAPGTWKAPSRTAQRKASGDSRLSRMAFKKEEGLGPILGIGGGSGLGIPSTERGTGGLSASGRSAASGPGGLPSSLARKRSPKPPSFYANRVPTTEIRSAAKRLRTARAASDGLMSAGSPSVVGGDSSGAAARTETAADAGNSRTQTPQGSAMIAAAGDPPAPSQAGSATTANGGTGGVLVVEGGSGSGTGTGSSSGGTGPGARGRADPGKMCDDAIVYTHDAQTYYIRRALEVVRAMRKNYLERSQKALPEVQKVTGVLPGYIDWFSSNAPQFGVHTVLSELQDTLEGPDRVQYQLEQVIRILTPLEACLTDNADVSVECHARANDGFHRHMEIEPLLKMSIEELKTKSPPLRAAMEEQCKQDTDAKVIDPVSCRALQKYGELGPTYTSLVNAHEEMLKTPGEGLDPVSLQKAANYLIDSVNAANALSNFLKDYEAGTAKGWLMPSGSEQQFLDGVREMVLLLQDGAKSFQGLSGEMVETNRATGEVTRNACDAMCKTVTFTWGSAVYVQFLRVTIETRNLVLREVCRSRGESLGLIR